MIITYVISRMYEDGILAPPIKVEMAFNATTTYAKFPQLLFLQRPGRTVFSTESIQAHDV